MVKNSFHIYTQKKHMRRFSVIKTAVGTTQACEFAAAVNGDPFLSERSTAYPCEFEFCVKMEDGFGTEHIPGVVRARDWSEKDSPWVMYVLPKDLQKTLEGKLCDNCTQARYLQQC